MFCCWFESRARRLSCLIAALIVGFALGRSPCAHAGSVVQISGGASTSLTGAFSGTMDYSPASPFSTVGTLVITLTNTSNPANGGTLAGLLFNIGGDDAGASALLTGASHPFINCTGNGLSGGSHSDFDGGAALGGSFLGGGNPNPPATHGIAVGETGVFTFRITAADAGSLTTMDFFTGGGLDFNFLARFAGFESGGSANVGAIVVPLPPALAMGLVGLGFMGAATLVTGLRRRARAGRQH